MEEFGKYFSLSSYVFYTRVGDTRDLVFENKYIKELYSHPFKQRACFGRDGFYWSDKLWTYASKRKYEDFKQSATYVGFKRIKGNICYNKPYYNPLNIKRTSARKQVIFLNNLLIDMAQKHIDGIIEMDEEPINKMLSLKMITNLTKYKNLIVDTCGIPIY